MAATTSEPGVRTPRVATTVPVALGVFVVYVVVFIGAMKASGIDYDDVIDTAGNTWRAVVLPLAGGSVWLALFAWWSRWDNVFRDPRRLPMGVWLWAAPGFMVVVLLLRFGGVAWGDFTAGHLAAIAVGSVLVGFAEETLFRGVILRALRNGARHEGQVVLWTSLWFGFFHATNLITGQSIAATVQQIFAASLFGVALFLARRARGLLLWGMVLHGVWDMSSFFSGARDSDSPLLVISGLLSYVLMLFAVVALVVVWRRHDVVADA